MISYSNIFLSSYLGASLICGFFDFYYPHFRITEKDENIFEDYKKIGKQVSKNLLLSIPIFYLFENYFLQIKSNIYDYSNFYYYFLWLIFADLLFYAFHKTVHTPALYFLHKQHHEYRYPYGIAAIYCSYIELVFGNLLPLLLPCYFLSIPDEIIKNLIVFSTFWTVMISHSSLQHFNIEHNIHHQKLKYNYGLFLSDYIFNTNYKKKM